MMNIKLFFVLIALVLCASVVYADCKIKVLPMGGFTPTVAKNAGQIRFPNFPKYGVLKERTGGLTGDSVEFVASDVRTRAEADRLAGLAAKGSCTLVPRPLCQMKLEAPHKVKVKMSTLVKQVGGAWQPEFSEVISIIGANGRATVLQNLELFRGQKAALGCDWDPDLSECSITRNFSSSRKRPQYNLRIGLSPATGLPDLTYEGSNELMGQLGSTMDFSDESGSDANGGASCRFTEIPEQLECSIARQSSGFVVRFGALGNSERFSDREAACQLLSARVTAGECRASSTDGEEVCAHPGVRSGDTRPTSAPLKGGDSAPTVPSSSHEESHEGSEER